MRTTTSASFAPAIGTMRGSPESHDCNNAVATAAALLFVFLSLLSTRPAAAQTPAPPQSTGSAQTTAPPGKVAPAPAAASATLAAAAPAPVVKTFVTIGDKPAIMFDAPSTHTSKIFIINALSPLEVLAKLDKWTKVRDSENVVGWVETAALGDRRHVQVSAMSADIRAMPAATAALVFDAQRAVLLAVTGLATPDGWLPVKHRDGQSGFVRLTQVWGD